MTINTSDLTTQVIDGTGAFDALMHTVKLHLQEEFDSSRISNSDYTAAYIQLMGTAMQVAVQYAISKPSEEAKVAEMNATLPFVIANAESTANKSGQELQLLWEKTMTERANTQESILSGYGSTITMPVLGVVGKQKSLYTNQADGYLKDHKVKVAKLYSDVAAVQLSSNDVYTTQGNGLADVNIATAMGNLLGSM